MASQASYMHEVDAAEVVRIQGNHIETLRKAGVPIDVAVEIVHDIYNLGWARGWQAAKPESD